MSTPLHLIAAPFTPMTPDGALDPSVVPAQAEHLRRAGVGGVFVGGTTGEWPSLSTTERERLAEAWQAARTASGGGLELIVHVGHGNLREARALAGHAASIGADAIAALPPHFFRPAGAEEVVEVCAQIAAAAPDLPFLYYHLPSMTGVEPPMAAFVDLAGARIPSFAGVKFTDHRLAEFDRVLERGVRAAFGRDEALLGALALGAREAVGSTYNFAAPLFLRMAEAGPATARALQRLVRQAVDVCERYGGLPALKALASMTGPELGPCRPPLGTLTEADRASLAKELDALLRELGR
ncbi:dihydrodipicolinate synthase family protein [Nonomuraea sp. NBC_01738]|uniref:dihydrodipicolinate synthase family protein n=1 Tax=Nonomuraea sp. NBC_01738 TaxID=2976003 RepID=UPI002E128ED5|nr:dihydrodipicolinate synthase family protein [Nonomuraea sp. NBC_01738]